MEFRANIGLRVRKVMLPRAKGIVAMKQCDSATTFHFHLLAPTPEHFVQSGEWLA